MLWSGCPRLGVLECTLLKGCMCAILQIYFGGKIMFIKDIRIWTFFVFSGVVFKQSVKERRRRERKESIF